MVKLDNWETKAEKAAIRRIEAKKRKQRRDQTRCHKLSAKQLLNFLGSLPDQSKEETNVHIWVETLSKDGSDVHESGEHQTPSSSHASPKKASSKRRTKTLSNSTTSENEDMTGICAEFFFFGTCSNTTRKSPAAVKKKQQLHSFFSLLQNQGCSCGRHPQRIHGSANVLSQTAASSEDNSYVGDETLYQVLGILQYHA